MSNTIEIYAVSRKYSDSSDDRNVLGVFTSIKLAEKCRRLNGIGEDGEDYYPLFGVTTWHVDPAEIQHETVYAVVPDVVRDEEKWGLQCVCATREFAERILNERTGEFAGDDETTYRVAELILDSGRPCGIKRVGNE